MRFVKESRIAAAPATVFAFHESPGVDHIHLPFDAAVIGRLLADAARQPSAC